jgi:hypothetical protein
MDRNNDHQGIMPIKKPAQWPVATPSFDQDAKEGHDHDH